MNSRKTKAQLIEELKTLRKQLTKAEKAEAEHKHSSRFPSHRKMNKGSLMRNIEYLTAAFSGRNIPRLFVAFLFILVTTVICRADTTRVKIGVLAKRGTERCLEKWGPTADYLTAQLPEYSFEIVPLSYEEILPAVENGDVDFILANPSFYVELEMNYGVNRLVTLKNLREKGAYTVFGGVIFCKADRNDLQELDDLKGKSFMAADQTSLGGWHAPWRELKAHGINPYRDFADMQFGGTHDAVVYAVRDGEVDAGVVRTDALERMDAEGKINIGEFRVFKHHCPLTEEYFPFVHSTRLYPEWPLADTEPTPDELGREVAVALLQMPADCPAARAAKCAGWSIPLNYQSVHECLKELRVGPYKDLGKITFAQAFRQYWYWLVIGICLIVLLFIASSALRVWRINRRLYQFKSDLEEELVERKQAEEALRESEERHRAIFETAEDSIFTKDCSLKYTRVNPAMEKLFGISAEKLISKSDVELFGEEVGKHIHEIDRCVLGGEVIEEEHTKSVKGVTYTFHTVKVPLRDSNGDIIGLCGIARDITERKKQEEILDLERKQLLSIFDSVDEIIYVADPETYEVLYANPTLVKAFNKKLVGETCYKALQNRETPCEFCTNEIILKNKGKPYRWEYHNPVINRDYDITDRIIKWTDGRDVRFELAIDITERKQSEKTMRLFLHAAGSSIDGIAMSDLEGRIIYVNEAFVKMFGYARKELIRKKLSPMCPADQQPRLEEAMKATAEGGWKGELVGRKKDGELFPMVLTSSRVVNDEGNAIAQMAIYSDNTERKQAEKNQFVLHNIAAAANTAEDLNELFRTIQKELGTLLDTTNFYIALYDKESDTISLPHLSDEKDEFTSFPAGKTFTSYVIKKGKPLLATEEVTAKLVQAGEAEIIGPPSKVWLGVPLKIGKDVIGAVAIQSYTNASAYSEKDLGVLQFASDQIAIVIQHKQAEEALAASELKFRSMFEMVPTSIVLTDEKGIIIDISPYHVEYFGKGREFRESYIGLSLPEHPSIVTAGLSEFYTNVLKGEKCALNDVFFPTTTGGPAVFVNAKGVPILRDDTVIGAIFLHEDITERKQAEKALQKRTSDLGERVKEQNCLYAVSNLIGRRDISLDEILQQIVGLIPSGWRYPEITYARISMNGKEFKTDNFRETAWKQSSNIKVHGEQAGSIDIVRLEEKLESDEGPFMKEERNLLNAIAKHLGEGIELHQMEETKRELENQLRQAQKMEAIGTLAGGIAHDFNNILAAMLGYADMAQREVPENNRVHNDLEAVLKAGDRAKDLVKQILAFSRQAEHESQPIQIHPVIKEALKLLRASLPATIEIREEINGNCGAVMGDPTQIHQVLMNLCTNAHYAMREKGGVLEVHLDAVDVTAKQARANPNLQKGPFVVLTVSDTGHGMDSVTLERIFEPFYTTKPVGEGTGMGLSTTHGIVKSHNGAIVVTSDLGKGSTFKVYLPKLKVETSEKASDKKETPKGSENILFVDDEEVLADLGQRMLGNLGYKVTMRTSSVEALEAFRAQPDRFDLVVTDQTMPDMTGVEFATEVMHIRPDIPVILITGFSEVVTTEKAKQLGIRDYILKPVMMAELGTAIRQVLDEDKKGD